MRSIFPCQRISGLYIFIGANLIMFFCCKSDQSSDRMHRVILFEEKSAVISVKQMFLPQQLHDSETQVAWIVSSTEKQKALKEFSKSGSKFTDVEFRPSLESLGPYMLNAHKVVWNRLTDIYPKHQLLHPDLHPHHFHGWTFQDKFFATALAALSELPVRVNCIFSEKGVVQAGVYGMIVKENGKLKQILIDDFIPTLNNKPIFSRPKPGQPLWLLLLQKVWAKVNGSYERAAFSTPRLVHETFTYAPSLTLFTQKEGKGNKQSERQMKQFCRMEYPVCICGEQCYSLLQWIELTDQQQQKVEILKLRKIAEDSQPYFLDQHSVKNYHALRLNHAPFFFNFKDFHYITNTSFQAHFRSFDVCLLRKGFNYFWTQTLASTSRASLFQLQVKRKSRMVLTFNYDQLTAESKLKGVMIVGQWVGSEIKWIQGADEFNYGNVSCFFNQGLQQGSYVVYCKFYESSKEKREVVLGVYSEAQEKVELIPNSQLKGNDFLGKVFTRRGVNSKNKKQLGLKNSYITSEYLIGRGDFGYVYIQLEKEDTKVFRLDLNQQLIEEAGFKLKGSKLRSHLIRPGGRAVLIFRKRDNSTNPFKFPPPISLLEQVE